MKFFILIPTALFFLAACQSALIRTNNSYLEVASYATIEITQSLEVSPNSARAYLQNGELIPPAKLDLYNVNCEIEINTVKETRQIIKPGTFNVIAISQDESPIVMLEPVRVASLNYAWLYDSPVDIKLYYRFRLSPAQAPEAVEQAVQVRSLICRGVQAEPYRAELPTLEQMRAASGRFVKFNL